MKLEISDLMARVLTRLLSEEIENQQNWLEADLENGFPKINLLTRQHIIEEAKALLLELERSQSK